MTAYIKFFIFYESLAFAYVVVQFCFWFNLDFPLFFSMIMNIKQRKIQIEPKTKLN